MQRSTASGTRLACIQSASRARLTASLWYPAYIAVALTALWLGLAVPTLAATQAPAGYRRVALVVGNSAYKEAPLRNPANDARAMAQKLRTLGFDVIALENATQTQMTDAIIEFSERLTDEGVALVYFAGHGMQVKGRNFLIPVDARITSEASVRNATIDANQILDSIGDANKRTNIVILDACRNNPFGRFRGGGNGLAQINAPAGTLIAYATAPGMTASDGAGSNGTYTAEILQAMEEPGLRVEDLFKRVRANVLKITGSAQTPWESSSLIGDFYFVGPTTVNVTNIVKAPSNDADKEMVFWGAVRDSSDAGAFQAYLRQYPEGAFAELARFRIQQLTTRPSTPPPAATPPVAAAPVPAPIPIAEIENLEADYVVVRRVNVRETPSKRGRVVHMLEAGTKVAVTGRQPDHGWYRVALDNSAQGWVVGSYLEAEEDAARRQADEQEEAQRRAEAREMAKSEEAKRVMEAKRAFARSQQDAAQQKKAQTEAQKAKTGAKQREVEARPRVEEVKKSPTPEKKGFFRQVFDDVKGSFEDPRNSDRSQNKR